MGRYFHTQTELNDYAEKDANPECGCYDDGRYNWDDFQTVVF
jgi:hypothetical protein